MKTSVLAVALLCLSPVSVFAADPCEAVLCLYGKVMGADGGSYCAPAQNYFFNTLQLYDSDGVFKPWATADYRKKFLNKCPSTPPEYITEIIRRFGTTR